MNQALASLPGGYEVRQTFVPSVGAEQYAPLEPLELANMCLGAAEMWDRIQDMYPFNVRLGETPVWDIRMWESRSNTAFAIVDWLKEEYVICRLRRSSTDVSAARMITRAKLYLMICEIKMATLGVVAISRRVIGVPVGPNRLAVARREWCDDAHLERDVNNLPRQVPAPVYVRRLTRRNSF
jgi:hypothetical protein